MRFRQSLLLVLLLLATTSAYPQGIQKEERHPEAFEAERQDLQNLEGNRLAREDAIRWIYWLVGLPILALLSMFFAMWWFYEPAAKNQNFRTNVKPNSRGQGADYDPSRGVGNDPL